MVQRSCHSPRVRFRLVLRRPPATRLAYVVAALALGYVALLLATGTPPGRRVLLLRYWVLAGAAYLAAAPPHTLFPDARLVLHQMLNRSPAALLRYHARRWAGPGLVLLVPGVVLAFYDPALPARALSAKGLGWATGTLLLAGTWAYALAYYATLGARSQTWQEGDLPRWYRGVQAKGKGFDVPQGLVPVVTATARIMGLAVLVLGVSVYAGHAWPGGGVVVAVAYVGGAAWRLLRTRAAYDRHFYQTNGFYGEIFQTGGALGEARAPVAYEAVYWAPHRWRPAVWASLRQLDRRLPLGRLVAVGHVLFWALLLRDAAPAAIGAYLLLFAAAKNATCYLLATPRLAPTSWQLARQAPAGWFVTRLLVNLRWTMPWVGSLAVAAWLDGTFGAVDALAWTGVDLLLAVTAAGLATLFSEVAARRRYA